MPARLAALCASIFQICRKSTSRIVNTLSLLHRRRRRRRRLQLYHLGLLHLYLPLYSHVNFSLPPLPHLPHLRPHPSTNQPQAECLYGGTNVREQIRTLKSRQPALVVATPGRLNDLLGQNAIFLGQAAVVVLDEADRMLDMGFEPEIKKIFAFLPQPRQTLFFTATWPKSVRQLAFTFLRKDCKTVFVGMNPDAELEANKSVSQLFIKATDDEKDAKLYKLFCEITAEKDGKKPDVRAIIFANTKRRVDHLTKLFWDEGFAPCAIHGDKKQEERDASLKQFATGERNLMFATDVAARGLDIKAVSHVINFDMARDVESYVHRIGRTGRAGSTGESITFWNPDYDKECSPALVKIAEDAKQPVPDWLLKFKKAKTSKQWSVAKAAKLL